MHESIQDLNGVFNVVGQCRRNEVKVGRVDRKAQIRIKPPFKHQDAIHTIA